jgi:hypothetical protein
MPDQSSASTEHALIQEITAPLATLPEDPVNLAATVDFPIVLRGYDRLAVDAYVKRTSQLVAELQATRSPESAVRRALERVGEEVSGILQRAHETAEQITAQSRSEAEDRLEGARQEAEQITSAAELRVKELDAETDRIWAERARIVEDSRDLARQLLGLTDSAAERFPADEEADVGAAAAPELGSVYDEEAGDAGEPLFEPPEPAEEPAEFAPGGAGEAHDDGATAGRADKDEDDETIERQATSVMPPIEAPPDGRRS